MRLPQLLLVEVCRCSQLAARSWRTVTYMDKEWQRHRLQQPVLLDQRRLAFQQGQRLQQPLLLDQRRLTLQPRQRLQQTPHPPTPAAATALSFGGDCPRSARQFQPARRRRSYSANSGGTALDPLREHIFGILVDVQVWWDGQYHSRPLPKTVLAEVQELVNENRWNSAAAKLCEPRREAHSSGSRSDS